MTYLRDKPLLMGGERKRPYALCPGCRGRLTREEAVRARGPFATPRSDGRWDYWHRECAERRADVEQVGAA